METTEKKVFRADRYIRKYDVTDEDMKQDIYLASLMSETPQAFSRRAKAILMSAAEEASTSVEEVSLEEVLERVSTEDEQYNLINLICEEQEKRDLRDLQLSILSDALNEMADSLGNKRSRDAIKCRLEDMTLKEMGDLYGRSCERFRQAEASAIRHFRRMEGTKELLTLLLEL